MGSVAILHHPVLALLSAIGASRTNAGRLLPRPDAPPAARLLRDDDANQGRRGRACAVAQEHAPAAASSHASYATRACASTYELTPPLGRLSADGLQFGDEGAVNSDR